MQEADQPNDLEMLPGEEPEYVKMSWLRQPFYRPLSKPTRMLVCWYALFQPLLAVGGLSLTAMKTDTGRWDGRHCWSQFAGQMTAGGNPRAATSPMPFLSPRLHSIWRTVHRSPITSPAIRSARSGRSFSRPRMNMIASPLAIID